MDFMEKTMDILLDILTWPIRMAFKMAWNIVKWPLKFVRVFIYEIMLKGIVWEIIIEMILIKFVTKRIFVHFLSQILSALTVAKHKWHHHQCGPNYLDDQKRMTESDLPCLQNGDYGVPLLSQQVGHHCINYASKGDSKNPLILCLHGFPGFWFSWRHQLKHFGSKGGWWVVAPNLADFAPSPHPDPTSQFGNYGNDKNFGLFHKLAEGVVEFLKSLEKQNCIIIAEGLGGLVAWRIAEKYPEMVNKLIVINSVHPGTRVRQCRFWVGQIYKTWTGHRVNLPDMPLWTFRAGDMAVLNELFVKKTPKGHQLDISMEELEAFKIYYGHPGRWEHDLAYGTNFFRSLAKSIFDGNYEMDWPRLVRLPTLVIRGEFFVAVNSDIAYCNLDFVEQLTVSECLGTNHIPQQSNYEAVNKLIVKFIE